MASFPSGCTMLVLWLLRSAQGRGEVCGHAPVCSGTLILVTLLTATEKATVLSAVFCSNPQGCRQCEDSSVCLIHRVCSALDSACNTVDSPGVRGRWLDVFAEQKCLLSKLWARLLSFWQSLLVGEDSFQAPVNFVVVVVFSSFALSYLSYLYSLFAFFRGTLVCQLFCRSYNIRLSITIIFMLSELHRFREAFCKHLI